MEKEILKQRIGRVGRIQDLPSVFSEETCLYEGGTASCLLRRVNNLRFYPDGTLAGKNGGCWSDVCINCSKYKKYQTTPRCQRA